MTYVPFGYVYGRAHMLMFWWNLVRVSKQLNIALLSKDANAFQIFSSIKSLENIFYWKELTNITYNSLTSQTQTNGKMNGVYQRILINWRHRFEFLAAVKIVY